MRRKNYRDLLLLAGIIFLDQFVKAMVQQEMLPGESIPVIAGLFHLTYVLNPGAAFGIMENQRLFFVLAGIGVICVAGYYYPLLSRMDRWTHYGMIALLGGAVGNLIDRIRSGLVVDFFDFRIWPVFNIADIAIVAGVACVIYAMLFRGKKAGDSRL